MNLIKRLLNYFNGKKEGNSKGDIVWVHDVLLADAGILENQKL